MTVKLTSIRQKLGMSIMGTSIAALDKHNLTNEGVVTRDGAEGLALRYNLGVNAFVVRPVDFRDF